MTSLPLLACALGAAGLLCTWRADPAQRAAHVLVTVAMAVMILGSDPAWTLLAVLALALATAALSNPWRGGCSPWHPIACAAAMAITEFDMVLGTHSSVPDMAVVAGFTIAACVQARHILRRRQVLDAVATTAGSLAMVAMGVSMLGRM
ncbi:hypothetical protein Caci_2628 [Catenulispora acidiphila DSM 44928]|uniref:Uncharacterized protein n=1 Tax=Catenulispora acidiphila (strain DSM 44928 / JCM 14897 / NBRC 102108 / NRRL B-24433 / ID139908) TaxID=479433 RepID=C7PZ88_CATAD|nr:hypothetical protein [Catenulispora acidiphila]ACU71545.1 hypothetical protein Caci_2628 [Catenulispora acidiphila DSM 44928]